MKTVRRIAPITVALAILALSTSGLRAQFVEDEELLPSGSTWDYLLYAPEDDAFVPSDPGLVDLNFHTTWQAGVDYDGPPFLSGPAPLGYDVVNGLDPLGTDIWAARDGNPQPPTNFRFTAYLRTTFTPSNDATALRLEGIIDDGAIFYLGGFEVARTDNLTGDPNPPDVWDLLATPNATENGVPVTIDLTGLTLTAGTPVTIGVALHNGTATSSDMGFDLRIATISPAPSTPAPNDDIANAEVIVGTTPITLNGRTHDFDGDLGASHEAGEPLHGGLTGTGSVWWSFTLTDSGRISLSTAGSNFDTVLAVYRGNSFDTTVEIGSANDTPFFEGDRLVFDAIGGVTYWVAVDGVDDGNPPAEGVTFGDIVLTIDVAADGPSILTPIGPPLVTDGSDWSYLLATENDQPIDPAQVGVAGGGAGDPDFHTTWHTTAGYDGPPFSDPAPALLGYGVINLVPIVTDIWGGRDHDGDGQPDASPPTGQRYATYFRKTFTPTEDVAHLGFRGLIDDGAAIFVNGIQVAEMNFSGDAADWQAFADVGNPGGVASENQLQEAFAANINLPANVEAEIAVTVRSDDPASSDIGFDLAVFSIELPTIDFGVDLAANDPLKASFETSNSGATSGDGSGGPIDNLPWMTTAAATEEEAGIPNPPADPGIAIFANGSALNLTTGNADLENVDNSSVVASIDFRAFEDSTGFEDVDNIEAYIEGSTDGIVFQRIADIMPLTTGGTPDGLKPFELPNGAYTTFSSGLGAITDDIRTIRVIIDGINNSGSERFYVDNLCIGTGTGTPTGPTFLATISRNRATGENTISWESDGTSFYELRFSTDMTGDVSTWVPIASGDGLATANHTPPAFDPANPLTRHGFYVVRRLPPLR